MIPDGTYTAVLDRLEDGHAILELDSSDGRYELVVEPTALPDDARHRDAVFHIALEDEEIVDVTYDEVETESRKETAQDRFDRISSRPPSEDDESA